jgi:hypothetical protein
MKRNSTDADLSSSKARSKISRCKDCDSSAEPILKERKKPGPKPKNDPIVREFAEQQHAYDERYYKALLAQQAPIRVPKRFYSYFGGSYQIVS